MKDQALYDRLISRIRTDEATGCWLWTGPYWKNRPWPQNRYGYISVYRDGKQKTHGTHRAMLIAIHGPLTREQCACHRCDVPLCINPEHLFIGTMKDNIWDSRRKGRHYESQKTHCDSGHPLSGDNLRMDKQGNGKTGFKRACKTCQRERAALPEEKAKARERQRLRRARQRAASASALTVWVIECFGCGALGPFCEERQNAAKTWNARGVVEPETRS